MTKGAALPHPIPASWTRAPGAFVGRRAFSFLGSEVALSRHAKQGVAVVGGLLAIVVGVLSLSQTVWASGGEYAVLEARVDRLETDTRADSERLRRIERRLIRMCAVTPGCE